MGPAAVPASGDRSPDPDNRSLADVVLVSNRGPLAFRLEDGRPVPAASGGGLAGSLHPLVEGTGATWVASSMSEADRLAAAEGLLSADGLRIELVEPEPDVYNLAYNVVSNATLWFCHHHLFDSARRPRTDQRWMDAWDAYRTYNRLMAERVAKSAPEGARILVQDYHLALMAPALSDLRPDLSTVHFTHTPFADPSVLRMLPTAVGDELLSAMSRFGACGFHSDRWAASFRAGLAAAGIDAPGAATFVSPLSSDPERLRASAAGPEVDAAP
jgi:trehalose 6-phosphate synthase